MKKEKLIEVVGDLAKDKFGMEKIDFDVTLGRKNATKYWAKVLMKTAPQFKIIELRIAPRLLEEKEKFIIDVL